MCGICGKISFNGGPVAPSLIRRMIKVMEHRGPDGSGVEIFEPGEGFTVGLGHSRLKIIDLTEAGRQPMCNEDGSVWVVFNGEIYNFLQLRKELEAKGHVFRSRTDTEVLLHLYEDHGEGCLDRLTGMFAFAIWDERRCRMLLARDRVGVKPLYYALTDEALIFGSEIKAILEDPEVERRPDTVGIYHYLTYQYVPAPWTAFRGIRKLPPAHYMTWRDGRAEVRRYWKLSYGPKHHLSEGECAEALVELLREATRMRLISDVPLGAFLSGGIDSSAVVALMSELGHHPIKTFSIGFPEDLYNELDYASTVSKRFGTEHHEFIVKPDVMAVLPKLVWHYNEPYADSSAIPTYYLAGKTREHVTVALNGDGGDESFGGYERYAATRASDLISRVPLPGRERFFDYISRCVPANPNARSKMSKIKRFLSSCGMGKEERYIDWIGHFNNEVKRALCSADFMKEVEGNDSVNLLAEAYDASDADDLVDATMNVDVLTYLPDDLLVKVDVATMAHSLEARSPFLDHRVMEFAARLPVGMKLHNLTKKYILKKALSSRLPEEVLRRSKMGFGVPLDSWFRNELKEMSRDILMGRMALQRGYFRGHYIKRMFEEHQSGRRNWHYQLWNLLLLELWHRVYIDS